MATLFIPAPFRKAIGNLARLDVGSGPLSSILREVDSRYPRFSDQLYGADGSLKKYVKIFVNGKDIMTMNGLSSEVGSHDEVFIISAMAGG